ncbi:hypothetical protein Taro_003538 [Colocasia esculenta]|uniref:RNase H type-1 domain-containing protein n=1 Tax=Colocasia esculenta TaxID=4460 RepID=A0A843TP41_COLES|nr:hypothetical protein [Colocasia esculenta]
MVWLVMSAGFLFEKATDRAIAFRSRPLAPSRSEVLPDEALPAFSKLAEDVHGNTSTVFLEIIQEENQVKVQTFKLVRWIPPEHGLILNVDGSSKGNLRVCGGGGCIRDSKGNLMVAFAHYYGFGSSLVAEVRSLCDGIQLASEHGFCSVFDLVRFCNSGYFN